MGKKKIPKSFTICLLAFFCSLFAIVVIVFGIMFFSPGTEIFGYQYISFTEPMTRTYTSSSEISTSNITAFKIVTDCSFVTVNVSQSDSQVSVVYNRNIYGIVKTENAEIVFNDYVIGNQSFEEDDTSMTYRTMVIEITEPSGWIACSDSNVQVYLPSNISFEVVYLSSEKGDITYNSTTLEKSISAKNLYLMTSGGDVSINNTQPCDNYYLETLDGKVSFNSASITAQKVKFESENGTFNLTNSTSTATITVTDGFYIKSTGNVSVSVDILVGNLDIDAQSGTFSFDTVGSEASEKLVNVHSASSTFSFGTIYGVLSVLGNENVSNNSVTVGKLVNTSEISDEIISGSGNVVIDEMESPAMSISSTSGNIFVQKVATTTDVYVYSVSGAISISYNESSSCVPETTVKVFSKTGSISLNNISGFFEVEVLENSAFSRLDIVLCAVCYETGNDETNTILAKNRSVNLTLKGYQNDLICRILSRQSVNFVDSSTTQVNEEDLDYILEDYVDYNYEYRVGYTCPTNGVGAVYDGKGKVFINGSGSVVISFQID